MLHHKNIHPRLMIANHQIPVVVIQSFPSLNIPLGFLGQSHPAAVAGNPVLADPVKNFVQYLGQRGIGQEEFGKGEEKRITIQNKILSTRRDTATIPTTGDGKKLSILTFFIQ